MAKCKPYDLNQAKMIPLCYADQNLGGINGHRFGSLGGGDLLNQLTVDCLELPFGGTFERFGGDAINIAQAA